MKPSLWLIAGGAVAVFWAVGAYNRLVRLRAAVRKAFEGLDAQLERQAELVRACLPQSMVAGPRTQPGELMDEVTAAWAGLRAAGQQFAGSLAAVREHPLAPAAMEALMAAQDALDAAWLRVQEQAVDLAGDAVPDHLQRQREHVADLTVHARGEFNAAVHQYNAAIAEFPAGLIARLWRFRPARGLDRPLPSGEPESGRGGH